MFDTKAHEMRMSNGKATRRDIVVRFGGEVLEGTGQDVLPATLTSTGVIDALHGLGCKSLTRQACVSSVTPSQEAKRAKAGERHAEPSGPGDWRGDQQISEFLTSQAVVCVGDYPTAVIDSCCLQ